MLLQLALYEQPVGHRVVHAVHRLVGNLTWGPLGGLSGAGVGGLGRWLRSFEPTEGAEALDVPTENGILAAVPKKRTSHQKKRQRQLAGNNHQKPLHNIGRCPACGHYKRAHTLCMHCVQEIQRVWRMRDRAEATKLAEATKSSPSPLSPEDAAFNYPERLSKPSEYNRKLSDRSSYILKHPRTLPVPPKKVHPLGIRPSGNALLNVEYSRIKFMGSLGYLPDELIMVVLQELCPADLIAVGCACKALYAFASFDELWKHIVHSYSEPPKRWLGTWKNTALGFKSPTIDCSNRVFSDFLYRPFELSQVNYSSMLQELDSHTIKKYAEREVTEDVFNESLHEKPFIVELEGAVANWTISGLVEEFGDETFRQEYMNWPLRVYQEYMSDNCDETPLYLFDCDSRAHEKLDGQLRKPLPEVWGPKHDLFSLFGSARPDHQWLILGPQRSGSTFHKDPNGTSAWNSLISGKKYWLFFPPSQNPPGVWTDADQSEVTAPVSLAEWFSCGFYKEALHTPGVLHAITEPGHCMYVPTGWWHAVVNLSDTIAMTGNFVPRAQFLRVAEFLRSKPDQISGFRDPDGIYKQFMDLVNDNHPSLASQIKHDERKRRWTEVVKSDKLFTFGFS